jgi:adenine-specific DNA-methyltransferase
MKNGTAATSTGASRYQNNSNFKNKSMSQPTGYPGQSILSALTPNQQKLEILRQHFPQAIEVGTDGHIRINAQALQLALDPSNPAGIQVEEDGYELRWVGKREAYHSAFVPVQKIIAPLELESKNWNSTGNLLIKGDNLDALRLLRHSYFGKVKLIYIDPPYNTQSDAFIYRDDFSTKQSDVLEQLGYSRDNIDYIKNIYGARTHSGWLSFMYPRLLLAKDLLRDDGVIFISIDDNEQAQLKLLCDEVFGQENFVAELVWEGANKNDARQIGVVHEYLIVYANNRDALPREWGLKKEGTEPVFAEVKRLKELHRTDDDAASKELAAWFRAMKATPSFMLRRFRYIDSRGAYKEDDPTAPGGRKFNLIHPKSGKVIPLRKNRGWGFDQDEFNRLVEDGRISFITDNSVMVRRYLHETDSITPPSVYYQPARSASERLSRLMDSNVFEFPKDETVLNKFIEMATDPVDPNCIVMDFFAGSATTGHAVMLQNAEDGGNRQFILVQIPQPIDAKKQKEAHRFVTETLGKPEATIFEITAERLRRAGAKIEAEQAEKAKTAGDLLPTDTEQVDTGFRVFDLVDDPDALILRKPLQQATQADVAALQASIATPQPEHLPRILYNLLLSESLPLTTPIRTIKDQHLYLAGDVALVVKAIALTELTDALRALKADGTPLNYLTVYAPWIEDSNFMLGINTVAESLGFSSDKLRLRG